MFRKTLEILLHVALLITISACPPRNNKRREIKITRLKLHRETVENVIRETPVAQKKIRSRNSQNRKWNHVNSRVKEYDESPWEARWDLSCKPVFEAAKRSTLRERRNCNWAPENRCRLAARYISVPNEKEGPFQSLRRSSNFKIRLFGPFSNALVSLFLSRDVEVEMRIPL